PDADGFFTEAIDFDPAGLFRPDILFYPVPEHFVGLLDQQFHWSGSAWVEPFDGYAMQKLMKLREKEYTDALQLRMDEFAKTRGYDNLDSASKYLNAAPPLGASPEEAALIEKFRLEATHLQDMASLTWARCYVILGEVVAGARPMPELEELFAELPPLAWPEERVPAPE
ncbi:MAG: hypothetical protein LBC79_09055, partial [Deltaproteobacteria bacterium]|nr:hypothetical protein [Deltaproteobacteria bacterium]